MSAAAKHPCMLSTISCSVIAAGCWFQSVGDWFDQKAIVPSAPAGIGAGPVWSARLGRGPVARGRPVPASRAAAALGDRLDASAQAHRPPFSRRGVTVLGLMVRPAADVTARGRWD